MRVFLAAAFSTALAFAGSHPSWWTLASPDATALVGIRWDHVRDSPFADAVRAELRSSSGLGIPDLACLENAREILISSPTLLALATGDFSTALLREQTATKAMKPSSYRGVPMWIGPGDAWSVALMSQTLLLIGARKTVESAIDRSEEAGRDYSPLLAEAAQFSQKDLWVVATRLPDPLASLFIPLDTDARGFEGSVSLQDGLQLDATLDAGSEDAAAFAAQSLTESIPTLPSIARGLQVTEDADRVLLSLDVSREQLAQSLRSSAQAVPQVAAKPAPAPVPAAKPEAPSGPQVIHIYGLDGGPREIVLPPVKKPGSN